MAAVDTGLDFAHAAQAHCRYDTAQWPRAAVIRSVQRTPQQYRYDSAAYRNKAEPAATKPVAGNECVPSLRRTGNAAAVLRAAASVVFFPTSGSGSVR
jgi:hypothetical protein